MHCMCSQPRICAVSLTILHCTAPPTTPPPVYAVLPGPGPGALQREPPLGGHAVPCPGADQGQRGGLRHVGLQGLAGQVAPQVVCQRRALQRQRQQRLVSMSVQYVRNACMWHAMGIRMQRVSRQCISAHIAAILAPPAAPTCRTAYTPAFGRGCCAQLATSPAANTSPGPPSDCRHSVIARKPWGSVGSPVWPSQAAAPACVHHRHSSKASSLPSSSTS